MQLSRGAMIAVIVIAVAIVGGVGFMWLNNKPQPPANYQPIMPPGGYSNAASGPQTSGGGGYPGASSQGQPGYPSGSPGYPSGGR